MKLYWQEWADHLELSQAAIAAKTAERNAPASADDLQEVRELFELGKDELARRLGQAVLKIAGSEQQIALRRTGADKLASTEEPKEKRRTRAEVRLMEASGFRDIKLNDEGTEIVSYTAPGKKR